MGRARADLQWRPDAAPHERRPRADRQHGRPLAGSPSSEEGDLSVHHVRAAEEARGRAAWRRGGRGQARGVVRRRPECRLAGPRGADHEPRGRVRDRDLGRGRGEDPDRTGRRRLHRRALVLARPHPSAVRPAAALAERLGLLVGDSDLITQALVHTSWLHEHPDDAAGHNERLEFLGDAVVNLAISDALFAAHPTDDEGVLSARRAAILSTLGPPRPAHRIALGSTLFLGEGEAQRGGRRRPSILASAFEALAGALSLEIGFDATRDWLVALAAPEIATDAPISTLHSPKSRLQEFTQRQTGSRPEYHVVDATGPDHEKLFQVEVVVDGRALGTGSGPSRRVAETAAAERAIDTLRREAAAAGAAAARPGAAAGQGGPGGVALEALPAALKPATPRRRR